MEAWRNAVFANLNAKYVKDWRSKAKDWQVWKSAPLAVGLNRYWKFSHPWFEGKFLRWMCSN